MIGMNPNSSIEEAHIKYKPLFIRLFIPNPVAAGGEAEGRMGDQIPHPFSYEPYAFQCLTLFSTPFTSWPYTFQSPIHFLTSRFLALQSYSLVVFICMLLFCMQLDRSHIIKFHGFNL